ncbi:diguanylate cyclase domain-containing protein [Anoxynatronum buryatiense]|uniref:Diguanylate cyclase (GGDEF) domain-containing protein n=1 Tax=Anoxynatronum buryatiense TaxID=489973 RepID=A0AA45WWZ2_9CLOT|nr:diguanylate cyclase [Anoxynatronum buryatiense]SMP61464.1 diguanylate cyclase (GGDEF) domain-containing protein [Anoxynatronum buryatiense]
MPLSQFLFWGVPIIALVSYCLLMLFLVLSTKDRYIKTFMLVLGALILWTASALFMRMDLSPGSLFWNRIMVTGMFFVPFLIHVFVSVLGGRLRKLPLFVAGIALTAALAANFSGMVVQEAAIISTPIFIHQQPTLYRELTYKLGPLAIPVYILFFLTIFSVLVQARKASQAGTAPVGSIRLVVTGTIIMFVGVVLNLVPMLGRYPLDILATFINALLLVVAIYKYRMLELRFMITRGLAFFAVVAALITVYLQGLLWVDHRFTLFSGNHSTLITLMLIMLIAATFQPLIILSRKVVSLIFQKADYSRRQALKNFSLTISGVLSLEKICESLTDAVQSVLRTRKIFVMTYSENSQTYDVFHSSSHIYHPELTLETDHPLPVWFRKNETSLTSQAMKSLPYFKSMWDQEKRLLDQLDIEVIVPVKSRNELTGMILLSSKEDNRPYQPDDLDLLTYLGTSTGVAFDNARLYAAAQAEAHTDSLTKLYNHRYFCRSLAEQIEQVGSGDLSLLLIDLDYFKLYNDLYGHFDGDRALQQIAAILTRLVGTRGIVSRYGGEEFTVLLPHHPTQQAYEMAERIRIEIQQTFMNSDDVTQQFLTASIGICTYPRSAPNGDELLKRADFAMYTAKNKGKNQTVIYTPASATNPSSPSKSQPGGNFDAEPSYAATIYALTAAIDAKDQYTFGHSQRVAEYAVTLGKSLNLDPSHLMILKEAALLHDIGKIGIPEQILNKTGPLIRDELEVIRKHVEMSITIVKHLPSLTYVLPAVIGHHERWDGKGYPRGTQGENTPLLARCLAIADTFDAMTSDRPYHRGMGIHDALHEIERNAGTQFDPELVVLFSKLVKNKTISINQNYRNSMVG